MKRYVDVLGSISHTTRGGTRVAEIVAALTPPARRADLAIGDAGASSPALTHSASDEKSTPALEIAPGVVSGIAGAFVWKEHRVLGFLAGHAIGASAVPFIRNEGNDRRAALCQLGIEGAGVAGALGWKKHPILGWFAGGIAGAIASAFVVGSPMNVQAAKMKAASDAK